MRTLVVTIALLFSAGSLFAQSFDHAAFMKANEAGQIIGGADPCGFHLDDAKTKAFMETKVAELDDTARMHFNNARSAQTYLIGQMGPTEKKAHCALQAKLAQKLGLAP